MHILGLDHCQLLERLKKHNDTSLTHDVAFDEPFWDSVTSRLVGVVHGVLACARTLFISAILTMTN